MITKLLNKAVCGERLSPEEGFALLKSHDLAALGRAANEMTRRLHPVGYRTYNIDRNINYTNICTAVCDFCAFYRKPKSDEGWVLPREELLVKVDETVARGGNQILMQGGLHPEFKIEWYEQLLRDIKARQPSINIHGFSPPEIHHFTKVSKLPLHTVLERLRHAGLGSRSRRHDPRQSKCRRLAKRDASLAQNGWAEHRHNDVWSHRNIAGKDRAPRSPQTTTRRNRGIYCLYLLDVPA